MFVQPLFQTPDFENYLTTFTALLETAQKTMSAVLDQNTYSWSNLAQPLDEIGNQIHIQWAHLAHLHHVMDTETIRALHERCLPLLIDYQTTLAQNTALYSAFKQIQQSPEYRTLTPAQQRSIQHSVRDFELSGVNLPEDKKAVYRRLNQALAEYSTQFQQHLIDAKQAWHLTVTDPNLLKGLPPHTIEYTREEAQKNQEKGWRFTLEMPCYLAVLSYADDRSLRQQVYEAYVTRASDLDDPAFDNSALMHQILSARHELALLLGFDNFASYSLATKMLKKPVEVFQFLHHLSELAVPPAQKEYADVVTFAQENSGLTSLAPWDVTYYSEKLQKARYHFNTEELRPYFPLEKVLKGLFELVHTLYHVDIRPCLNAEVWHPDVRCFSLHDAQQKTIAYVYIDLYARQDKQNGAWMDDLCGRYRHPDGNLQLPVAFLVCNFTRPSPPQPALLTHDDVITLFHEFGHGLHHLLTRMDVLDIAGISGVEWDAVELPSQFMENFCWEKSVLDKISGHIETGEPLPEDKLKALKASKDFQSAMQLVRQLEFALFDFEIHATFTPDSPSTFIQTCLNHVRQKVAVVPIAPFNRFQHGFSHIFAGGYAAGYYSYKWAEVLSCDAYDYFVEQGILSRAAGQHFLDTLLSQGSVDDMRTLFQRFRGREPDLKALLKHAGLSL